MAYTDYEFYTTKFYGEIIPEESFDKYADKASDRIDRITFDRLVDGLPEDERSNVKVQKAVCAVADALYQIDQIKTAAMAAVGTVERDDGTITGKVISSVSSGSESISYSTNTANISSAFSAAATDKSAEDALIIDTATEYLAGVATDDGVNLLYAGV